MLDLLSRPAVAAPTLVVLVFVLYQLFKPSGLPDVPVIGLRKGEWFAHLRASWRNTANYRQAEKDAYSHKDTPVIISTLQTGPFVQLRVQDTQWIVNQPESVISLHEAAMDSLRCDYTCAQTRLTTEPAHHKLITTTLTQEIGNLVPEIWDELDMGFQAHWGTDTAEFSDVTLFPSVGKIVGQVTNRVFVGLPHCRNPELVQRAVNFAQGVSLGGMALNFTPRFLRPVVAPVILFPHNRNIAGYVKLLEPEITKRLREYDIRHGVHGAGANGDAKLGPEAHDFLQWSINQAKTLPDPWFAKPSTLAERILLLNFAAIHTTSFGITHVLLDLISGDPAVIAELRAEIDAALAEHDGVWSKKLLTKLDKVDSVLRESARLNSFVSMGIARKVVAPGGVTLPSGHHVAQGHKLCAPSLSRLHDDEIYPDGDRFVPFRFANQRQDESVDYVKRARQAFPTTSTDFLHFGHGRGACPGRFFASNELKMMVAYALLHYDFEMQGTRPDNKWIGVNHLPDMKHTIRVRRRAKV